MEFPQAHLLICSANKHIQSSQRSLWVLRQDAVHVTLGLPQLTIDGILSLSLLPATFSFSSNNQFAFSFSNQLQTRPIGHLAGIHLHCKPCFCIFFFPIGRSPLDPFGLHWLRGRNVTSDELSMGAAMHLAYSRPVSLSTPSLAPISPYCRGAPFFLLGARFLAAGACRPYRQSSFSMFLISGAALQTRGWAPSSLTNT